jgi:hypothetical protein
MHIYREKKLGDCGLLFCKIFEILLLKICEEIIKSPITNDMYAGVANWYEIKLFGSQIDICLSAEDFNLSAQLL